MGFFKLIGKRGAARAFARSAREAYLKYKAEDSNKSEEEIAGELFKNRCSSRNLNKAEKVRVKEYLEKEETVDSLFKLCLAMIYIILNISEADVKEYETVRKVIEAELTRLGHETPSFNSSESG